jgi:IS30 family transposase
MKKKKQRALTRPFKRLSYRERVIIEQRFCQDRRKVTAIARELKRPTSAVTREIGSRARKGAGRYDADVAQRKADERAAKQGRKSSFEYVPLKAYMEAKLGIGWSPEQISIRLLIEYKKDKKMRISYEAIYQHVYNQIHRGGNGNVKEGCIDLRPLLARRHTRRQKKGFRTVQKTDRRDKLPSIEDRPRIVEKRKELGHWEDDTMVSRQSAVRLKTMNELVSGIIFIGRMSDGTVSESNRVVIKRMKALPESTRKTLTRDRGTENYGWKEIEKELNLTCWFAHPYCSHERGSNENGNGLIRRFFPKKTNFDPLTDDEITRVEYLLNSRPRKRLGGKTPYEVFYELTGVALDC